MTDTTNTSKKVSPSSISLLLTNDLKSLFQTIVKLYSENDNHANSIVHNNNDSDNVNDSSSSSSSTVSNALQLISINKALSILNEILSLSSSSSSSESNNNCPVYIPLNSIHAARSLIVQSKGVAPDTNIQNLLTQLENIHNNIQIQFQPISTPNTLSSSSSSPEQQQQQQIAYQKRLDRLRLISQERSYNKLTSNIDKTPPPDATIKSMMYATSVGMNMIVAPLSFGTFMYFFAGKLFSFLEGEDHSSSGTSSVDVKRVIAGVVSGVIMLFIEMILFVIRNHEMDKAITHKSKVLKSNPFGYVKNHAERTYHG